MLPQKTERGSTMSICKCKICRNYYDTFEHKETLQRYGSALGNIDTRILIENYCPQCIVKLIGVLYTKIQEQQRQQNILEEKVSEKDRLALSWLFKILVLISFITITYSLTSKFLPQLKLPNFPFMHYTIGYALFVFLAFFIIVSFIKSIRHVRINTPVFLKHFIVRFLKSPLGFIIVLINFAFPAFRNIFFSHFDKGIWTVIFTILFALSNIVSLSVIFSVLYQHIVLALVKKIPVRQRLDQLIIVASANLLSLPIAISLYFGLVSPYYLGVIKPGPFRGNLEPEAYRVDRVYEEAITARTADRQTARQYLIDGKSKAALGNMQGFLESIQLYEMALQLIPDFSTALAEMAYSYGSLGRILKDSRTDLGDASHNFEKAEEALNRAKKLNPENPGVYGVEAILEYYRGNEENARQTLVRTMDLASDIGYTDKVLLAMAILEKKKVKRVEYLLAIRQIDPDNAELLNLLGVAYYQIGNTENARKSIERAIRLNPNYSEANLNLALVSPDKENLYKKVMEENSSFKQTANYYLLYWTVQNWLRKFYLAMLIFYLIISFNLNKRAFDPITNTIRPEYLKRKKTIFRWCVGLFIFTYLTFEWNLHHVHRLNSLSHLFPNSFPFF